MVTAGKPATIQWTPTTQGPVSLTLRSGAKSNLDKGTVIACKFLINIGLRDRILTLSLQLAFPTPDPTPSLFPPTQLATAIMLWQLHPSATLVIKISHPNLSWSPLIPSNPLHPVAARPRLLRQHLRHHPRALRQAVQSHRAQSRDLAQREVLRPALQPLRPDNLQARRQRRQAALLSII